MNRLFLLHTRHAGAPAVKGALGRRQASSRISMLGNFSFQYANLLRSRTVITVLRSSRTLMLGWSSFSDFFRRAMGSV